MSKKKKSRRSIKKEDITNCSYFRMNQCVNDKQVKRIDMYCSLNHLISYSYTMTSTNLSSKDKEALKNSMKFQCVADCPKIWDRPFDIDYDDDNWLGYPMCCDFFD